MFRHLRSPFLLGAVLVPSVIATSIAIDSQHPVLAQEHQGCFLIDRGGHLFDLSDICPSATASADTPELGTGDIQVTLRWTTSDDLDLYVTDPEGQVVSYMNTRVASGGQLDVDANAGCSGTTSSPIENIFWPPSQAPQGQYRIGVNLFSRCAGGSAPVSFEVRLLVQGNIQTLTGQVDDRNTTVTFPFSLPLQR
ncbi:MAG TPA: hypothetical protein V6C78_20795 [Crinalium sp.]|jgi:hypothetical protein